MNGNMICPECGEQLPTESINLKEGVALCPRCKQLSHLSEVVSCNRSVAETLSQPPTGCFVSEWGQEVLVEATLHSISTFFSSLFVALFWNGIVSVFVLIAISGLYTNLVGPLPVWFSAPSMKDSMPLGMTLFLCVFLIPFVTIGSIMMAAV